MTLPISLCHWGPFEAEVEGGRLLKTRPWAESGADPAMIGALPDLVYSDQRIDQPYVREGWLKDRGQSDGSGRGTEAMIPVSWDCALDLVADEIGRIRDQFGHKALFAGSYGWSSAGRFHHARSQIRRFYGALGGFTDQTSNYSWGAAQIILNHVLGTDEAVSGASTSWASMRGKTDVLVAFGGLNPKNWRVTSGGAGTHHMPRFVRDVCASGTRLVVISPAADDIPEGIEAQWIAPRPGSDTAIMLALCHAMIVSGRADLAFLERYCHGTASLIAYLEGGSDGIIKSLAWAAALADVPLSELEELSELISRGQVMLTASWSLQRAQYGEQSYWALIALAAMLGQIGTPGGGFSFGYGSLNGVGETAHKGLAPSLPGLGNAQGMAIPVARIADMLAYPGKTIPFDAGHVTYPDIKLIHWAGGNPFHHAQDLFRLERLWSRPQTIIVNEPFWTATAKRADIILPATTSFERNDIGGTSRDLHVFYMPQLIKPVAKARDDFAIFQELAQRLDADHFTEGLDETGWLRRLWSTSQAKALSLGIDAPDFDGLRAMNAWRVPRPKRHEILMGDYRQDPKAHALATPSGRIELGSKRLASLKLATVPEHPAWLEPNEWLGRAAKGQLHLISRQPAHWLHSQLAQTSLGRSEQPAVMIAPATASALGLIDGQQVRVRSERGSCHARLSVSKVCRNDVAFMATGPWFKGGPERTDTAGNPNALTLDQPTSELAQATAAMTCLVSIEPF